MIIGIFCVVYYIYVKISFERNEKNKKLKTITDNYELVANKLKIRS